MAVPQELLDELGQLEGPIARIRNAIDALLAATRDPRSELPVGDGLTQVESVTDAWLQATSSLEERLRDHAERVPQDGHDVESRLGGLAMLHISVAADLAILSPFDDLREDDLANQLGKGLPYHPGTIQEAAFGEGALLQSLREPLDDEREEQDPTVDEAVADLIDRAGASGTAVVLALAGGSIKLFGLVARHLRVSIDASPHQVQNAVSKIVGRVGRLVGTVLHRARALLGGVLAKFGRVRELVDQADPAAPLVDSIASRVFRRVLAADDVQMQASPLFYRQSDRDRVGRRLGKLTKSHHRWVGPVGVVAKGLPKLWAVPLVPPPLNAAPLGAAALLAWTLFLTADMLDSKFPNPNLWDGVLRIAGGA